MKRGSGHTGIRIVTFFCAALFGAVLTWIVATLPVSSQGLVPRVQSAMTGSEVENPVTAVLLDFRAHDTLLEIGVLTLAMVAIRSFRSAPDPARGNPVSDVQLGLIHVMTPFAVLFAFYLLWNGTDRPGGAFQAGAALGALGVLMRLSAIMVCGGKGKPAGDYLWIGLIGLAMFTLLMAWELGQGHRLLEYPAGTTGSMILLIEIGAMVSIGYILTDLVCGGSEVDV